MSVGLLKETLKQCGTTNCDQTCPICGETCYGWTVHYFNAYTGRWYHVKCVEIKLNKKLLGCSLVFILIAIGIFYIGWINLPFDDYRLVAWCSGAFGAIGGTIGIFGFIDEG